MLSVRLNDHRQPALNVQFSCDAGQLLALVGPSGAGKSTVLRCIAGLHSAESGVIRCNGKDWFDSNTKTNLTPQQRRVGFVFQNYALFPHLTVAENIQLAKSNSDDLDVTNTLLEKVRLTGLDKRYPHELSGGQQQRVAIARALAREPDVLLLDEPFSAVDKVTRRKLYLELNSLRGHLDIPIILVTHDLDEAAMLADTLVVIHRGETLQQGEPQQVLHKPNTADIAKLVDVRNLFTGRLSYKNDTVTLDWNDSELTLVQDDIDEQKAKINPNVSWTISPAKVILHQRVRPSRGEHENPIQAVITEMLTLRGVTTILMKLKQDKKVIIQMDISDHVVNRNSLIVGDTISVSLLSSEIHIIYN